MISFMQALLLWSWQALLLVGIVVLTIRLDRSRSAASRHALWTVGICIIALLPAANLAIRALPEAPPLVAPISYVAQFPTVAAVVEDPGPDKPHNRPGLSQIVQWMILGGWAIGTLVSLARVGAARFRWKQIAASASEGAFVAAPVPVRYSREVDSPVLVGVLRPVILLPYGLESWTDESERRAMIEHELAHLARRDHWLAIFQAALGAVFFFHPAVRYALRQLEIEREIACDERVVAAGISPTTYADLILKVAERTIDGLRGDCPAFNASAKNLERRINMILRHSPSRVGNWRLATATKALLIVGCTASMLLQPSVMAETPLAGSEVQLARLQPLMNGMSLMMTAMAEQPPAKLAEPVVPVVAAAPAPVPAQAQAVPGESGTISGTVSDPSGAVVPGVQVLLESSTKQEVKMTATSAAGAFSFRNVAAGGWTLQTILPGFTNTSRVVVLRAGDALVENVYLPLARLRTAVQVTASKPAILATPPAQPGPPRPLRIGGDISSPNLIAQTKPQYPAAARAFGVQGPVQLQAIIAKDGTVANLSVDMENPMPGNRNPELVKAAMEAVQQWRYRPGLLNGQPIEFMTSITVNFALVD